MRVMPWEGSGRYSPGPGMVKLLEKWFYQELRPLMAICSLNPPGNLAIVSGFVQFYDIKDADTEYLYYALQHAEPEFLGYGQHGTQANLNTTIVSRHELFVPSPPEQRKIARILTTLDNLIENTEALIDKYQAIKQGMMHDLFSRGVDARGHLRPPRTEAPDLYKQSGFGWIPREWETAPLGDVAESVIDGPFGSNLKTEHYIDTPGVRVVRLQNIQLGRYSDEDRVFIADSHADYLSRHQVIGGDILVAALGEDVHPVGRACLYPAHLPPAINKADCFRVRCEPTVCRNAFMMYFLNGRQARAEIALRMQGMTRTRINVQNLKAIRTLVPSLEEQERIERRIDSAESMADSEECNLRLVFDSIQ